MRIPVSARKTPEKTYYVFFALGGKYDGCYTVVHARNYEAARTAAVLRYSLQNIGSVLNNEEQAKGKIKAYGLTKI